MYACLIIVCDSNSIFNCIFVKIILILLLILQKLFCRFLENGNRYRVEIFSVHLSFNDLSNDVSHFVVV